MSFDVYINKSIRHNTYKYTWDDVKNTIIKLEKLYKADKYPQKKWQVVWFCAFETMYK